MAEATATARRPDGGLTMLEVIVTLLILSTCALPLLIALADAQRQIVRAKNQRVMKQLLEYKLAHVLLDQPAEDEEPIYVDGAEGNFGEDFANDPEKAYWFDEEMYSYSYRIDSEELDLGSGGGITGEEESVAEPDPPPSSDPGGSPFGVGEGEETEEDLGQIRYRVTLTVFYRPGNANFDQNMSLVTYVRHPHHDEAMSGPDMGGGGGGLGGGLGGGAGGEAGIGAGTTTTNNGTRITTSGGGR